MEAICFLASAAEIRAVAIEIRPKPADFETPVQREIPLKAIIVSFPQEKTVFCPGGWNDFGFDAVAFHAVESRRLMDLVSDSDWHEDGTSLDEVVIFKIQFEVSLLQLPD